MLTALCVPSVGSQLSKASIALHVLCAFGRTVAAAVVATVTAAVSFGRSGHVGCIPTSGSLPVPAPPLCVEGDATAGGGELHVDWAHAGKPESPTAARLLASHLATHSDRHRVLWPPGRLLRLRRGSIVRSWTVEELPDAEQLRRIRLTPYAMLDHLPDKLLRVLQHARKQTREEG